MWRFKKSKFKNAAPKIPKKEECLSDIHAENLLQSCGNHIKASAVYMGFNVDSGGGHSVAVLPLGQHGRQDPGTLPLLHGHTGFVTDLDFSPCDDYLLATASQDCTVSIWHLPDEDMTVMPPSPLVTLTREDKKIENVLWHPFADGVLAATSHQTVKLFDVSAEQEKSALGQHGDQVYGLSWSGDGISIVTSCKDKLLRILDPRANKVVQECPGSQNIRESRVVWLADQDVILTTGFDMNRQREIVLRDVRNFGQKLKQLTVDSYTGVFMPLYDPDTNMLFLGGKGDTCIRYMEVSESDPYLTEASTDTVDQIKGLAMVPKRALDVMQCEVNRLLLLSKNSVVPIPYYVPRKSYSEFHEDLFPQSFSGEAALNADSWFGGLDVERVKTTLDPARKPPAKGRRQLWEISDTPANPAKSRGPKSTQSTDVTDSTDNQQDIPPTQQQGNVIETNSINQDPSSENLSDSGANNSEKNIQQSNSSDTDTGGIVLREKQQPRKTRVFSGVRQSKFRHLEGTAVHKSLHIDNVRNLSQNIPGESDGFHANKLFCAFPLSGSGGLVTVVKTKDVGRLPDAGIPAIQNGSFVMDFVFDPFDDKRLVTACDDAKIRIWNIPEDGLTETLTEPDHRLLGHTEKIYFVVFHPLAKDILASASYDMSVRIWNLSTCEEVIRLEGHTDTIFCLSWSLDGQLCATVCKDGRLRIYDPRKSTQPILEGPGPEGARGARLVWACDGKYLVVSGFNRGSIRTLRVYDSGDLSHCLHKEELDTSPAILIPHYDEDSSTLFLTGRGDSMVFAFEAAEDFPHLHALSNYKAEGLHQALSFFPKSECNIAQVEFAKAMRLTSNSIEPISFTVPRIKMEYFQDDIFPDTRVRWEPVMTSDQWLSGENQLPHTISLRPPDMLPLSQAPVEAPKPKKYESFTEYQKHYKTDDEKKDELLSAMTKKMDIKDEPLPQDLTEGVDSDEWDD